MNWPNKIKIQASKLNRDSEKQNIYQTSPSFSGAYKQRQVYTHTRNNGTWTDWEKISQHTHTHTQTYKHIEIDNGEW